MVLDLHLQKVSRSKTHKVSKFVPLDCKLDAILEQKHKMMNLITWNWSPAALLHSQHLALGAHFWLHFQWCKKDNLGGVQSPGEAPNLGQPQHLQLPEVINLSRSLSMSGLTH